MVYTMEGVIVKKEVEEKYIEFLNYYQTVESLIENIDNHCEDFTILLNGIVDAMKYYYEEKDNIKIDESFYNYFEDEVYVDLIFNRIEQIITFINNVYYHILEADNELFNSYIYVMEYIIFLEDLIEFLQGNNVESDKYELELKNLKNIIYNKEEVTEALEEELVEKEFNLNIEYKDFSPSSFLFKLLHNAVFNLSNYNQDFEQEQENYI